MPHERTHLTSKTIPPTSPDDVVDMDTTSPSSSTRLADGLMLAVGIVLILLAYALGLR